MITQVSITRTRLNGGAEPVEDTSEAGRQGGPDLSRPWVGETPPPGGVGLIRGKVGIRRRSNASGRFYAAD
eukprot:11205170-Lingulodinium_polyedra.AAC.1